MPFRDGIILWDKNIGFIILKSSLEDKIFLEAKQMEAPLILIVVGIVGLA